MHDHDRHADDDVDRSWLTLQARRERVDGETRLTYKLDDGNGELVEEQRLEQGPFEVFEELFEHIEAIDVGRLDVQAARKANRQLEGIGAKLARRLLPAALRSRLLSHHDPRRDPFQSAPILWIVSDEPWIPWELLRLPDGDEPGPFLGEAFAISRWLWDLAPTAALPLGQLGLVVPKPESSGLLEAAEERRYLLALQQPEGRRVESLEAKYNQLLDGFGAQRFTGWHFTGHGWAGEGDPDLWSVLLDDGELKATDLAASSSNLWRQRPFVFLNACRTARMQLALSGLGGLAEAFLEAGAGAFLGTHWSVPDRQARLFAQAFYAFFLDGEPIAEAMRQARLWLRETFPGDPTWLAYTAFAYPVAVADGGPERLPTPRWPGRYLESPWREWDDSSPPGAMLRADHRIVEFHRRQSELEELRSWCDEDSPLKVRLYTGRGGMGKTRLALEIFQEKKDQGWRSGFAKREVDDQPRAAARAIVAEGGPMLVVVDYAETHRPFLRALFESLIDTRKAGPFRVILLSRRRQGWWDLLKSAPGQVGNLLAGSRTSERVLGPLADTLAEREETYRRAAGAFADRLGARTPEDLPDHLDADYFKPVLMIHMQALGAVEGVSLRDEDGVLDWILRRERRFWLGQLEAEGLEPGLVDGMAYAMTLITLAGGAPTARETIEQLEALSYFRDRGRQELRTISQLLHAVYPGEHWIGPLLPDILGEHLLERVLRDPQVRDEIYDLVFGPKSDQGSAD